MGTVAMLSCCDLKMETSRSIVPLRIAWPLYVMTRSHSTPRRTSPPPIAKMGSNRKGKEPE